jgi:gliding motility-associated-like protein
VYNPETCNTTDTVRTVLVLPEIQQPIAAWNLATPDPCDPAGGSLNASFTGQNSDSLTWLTPLGTLTNENSIEVMVLEPGNYPITLIASESQCGFVDTLEFVFVHNPLILSVDTTASDPCSLPVVFNGTFTGLGHDNLTWSVNNEASSNQNAVEIDLPQGSHTITLVAQSAQCGSLSQSFEVSALGTVQATLPELPQSLCLGESLAITATADLGDLTWLAEGNSSGNTFLFQPLQSGNSAIQLIVSDALSCNGADTAQAFIQVVEPPIADFALTYLPELCQTEAEVSLVFTGDAAESMSWEMGDGSTYTSFEVQHTFTESGVFQITLTVEAPPCPSATYSEALPIELVASDALGALMYPNIFSPNDDGINDCLFFLPEGISSENFSDFSLRVFNRWGTLIHQSEEVAQRWCPRDLEQGTYYYILRYFDRCTGESVEREAAVTVVY